MTFKLIYYNYTEQNFVVAATYECYVMLFQNITLWKLAGIFESEMFQQRRFVGHQ